MLMMRLMQVVRERRICASQEVVPVVLTSWNFRNNHASRAHDAHASVASDDEENASGNIPACK